MWRHLRTSLGVSLNSVKFHISVFFLRFFSSKEMLFLVRTTTICHPSMPYVKTKNLFCHEKFVPLLGYYISFGCQTRLFYHEKYLLEERWRGPIMFNKTLCIFTLSYIYVWQRQSNLFDQKDFSYWFTLFTSPLTLLFSCRLIKSHIRNNWTLLALVLFIRRLHNEENSRLEVKYLGLR